MQFLENKNGKAVIAIVATLGLSIAFIGMPKLENISGYLAAILLSIALLILLASFASRTSALRSWNNLIVPHFLILAAVIIHAEKVKSAEIIMYISGVLIAYLLGWFSLQKTYSIDKNISLNQYHGYVYEDKVTALFFLIAAIGLLGFPVTAAFIGIDVFFTYVQNGEPLLITLLALCFVFFELAAIRIFLRIYMGPHKKLTHPVAFRSS